MFSLNSVWRITPENKLFPIIANIKNIRRIRDPTLAILGIMYRKESNIIYKFFENLINLNILIILNVFIILRILLTFTSPILKKSEKNEIVAIIQIKKSNLFPIVLKYYLLRAYSFITNSKL
jgi:hypothetical protein